MSVYVCFLIKLDSNMCMRVCVCVCVCVCVFIKKNCVCVCACDMVTSMLEFVTQH